MIKYTSLAFISFVFLTSLKAQTEIENIKKAWYNKKYSLAIKQIDDYYKINKPNFKLDLIKVSSMCMAGQSIPNPQMCFDYIKNAYKIPKNVTAIINKAKDNCKAIDLDAVSLYVRTASSEPPRTVGKSR